MAQQNYGEEVTREPTKQSLIETETEKFNSKYLHNTSLLLFQEELKKCMVSK